MLQSPDSQPLINDRNIKTYGINALLQYWPDIADEIGRLPVNRYVPREVCLPVRLRSITMPAWASDLGIDGMILVPAEVTQSDDWKEVNWWYVIFWYLNCLAERKHESIHGPVHSYSSRLLGWDERMWQFAWVNRIAEFLRRWALRAFSLTDNVAKAKCSACFYMTHDLDAVTKTFVIRAKQTAFNFFNFLKLLKAGAFRSSLLKLKSSLRLFFSVENYKAFDKLRYPTADTFIKKKIINVYGGPAFKGKGFKSLVIDPGYDIATPDIVSELKKLINQGFVIGMHQSFGAWADSEKMIKEKDRISGALECEVETCRQHWLRFSFEKTWLAQIDAGLSEDTTLGFNDRHGFRNGAALAFKPFDPLSGKVLPITVVPMVLMDSHLYDYQSLDEDGREEVIDKLLEEVKFVNGQASIIWHPHTLGRDYGWSSGFNYLLRRLRMEEGSACKSK